MKVFRFTKWIKGRFECDFWYKYFKERGVPVAVVTYNGRNNNKDSVVHALWREGVDAFEEEETNDWKENFRIRKSANGFRPPG